MSKGASKSLPLQLVGALGIAFVVGPLLGEPVLRIFYTFSSLFKELLMMVVPFVVFGYLMSAMVAFDKRSLGVAGGILLLASLSNFVAVWIGYGASWLVFPWLAFDNPVPAGGLAAPTLTPLFTIGWTSPFRPEMAMVLAFVGAFCAIFFSLGWLKALAGNVRDGSTRLLRHLFIPLLPLYVFGFILQLQYSGSFTVLMTTYSKVFLLTILVASLYIGGWYGVVGKLYGLKPLTLVRYMFPPALAGFTTMSSAAAMPVTLEGVEKIVKRREYVNFVVPLTASPHSLGDTLTITISALALLWMTGAGLPSPGTFAIFSLYFCLCKFSSAGVPGGGIYAVLWVLRDYLGFDTTLCDMITTAYLLQDPFLTVFNVSGNGAFAALTCRIFEKKTENPKEIQTPVEAQVPPSL